MSCIESRMPTTELTTAESIDRLAATLITSETFECVQCGATVSVDEIDPDDGTVLGQCPECDDTVWREAGDEGRTQKETGMADTTTATEDHSWCASNGIEHLSANCQPTVGRTRPSGPTSTVDLDRMYREMGGGGLTTAELLAASDRITDDYEAFARLRDGQPPAPEAPAMFVTVRLCGRPTVRGTACRHQIAEGAVTCAAGHWVR